MESKRQRLREFPFTLSEYLVFIHILEKQIYEGRDALHVSENQ